MTVKATQVPCYGMRPTPELGLARVRIHGAAGCGPCRLRLENVVAQRVPQQREEVLDDLAVQQRDGLHGFRYSTPVQEEQ